MRKSKELLGIRYISYIILIFQILSMQESRRLIGVALILCIIINNNIRIFYIKNEKAIILSVLIEILVCTIVHYFVGGEILLYLIGTIIDSFTLNKKVMRYISISIITVIYFISSNIFNFEESIRNIPILIGFYILLNYIERLNRSKLEAQSLYDKLRVSEEKLIEANNDLESCLDSIEELTLVKERNRISREIHDSVGHALSTAMIQLSAMEAIGKKEESSLGKMAGNLRAFINESLQDVRRAVKELKPDEYDNYQGILRLQEVCKNFEKLSGIIVNLTVSKGEWNLSTKQVSHLYRITQEVLSNSLRHGKATKENIIMNFTEEDFVISFKDNGEGTKEINETGLGLKSIRERTAELNGLVDMKSSLGEGFFIKITIPREKEI
ncbi:sensor histidine kinase [Clostridium paraputrificum]|uniref:sensor histidine kinase n=1 Tax=Clostridium TaxID=1485 RepID=UPI003D32F186